MNPLFYTVTNAIESQFGVSVNNSNCRDELDEFLIKTCKLWQIGEEKFHGSMNTETRPMRNTKNNYGGNEGNTCPDDLGKFNSYIKGQI